MLSAARGAVISEGWYLFFFKLKIKKTANLQAGGVQVWHGAVDKEGEETDDQQEEAGVTQQQPGSVLRDNESTGTWLFPAFL